MAKEKPTIEHVLQLAAQVDEAGIEAEIAELEATLKKLKDALGTIRVLKHGRAPRKQPTPRTKKPPASDSTKTIKQRVIDYLEIQSPAKPAIIAADTGLSLNQVNGVVANYPNRFRRVGEGYTLVTGHADD